MTNAKYCTWIRLTIVAAHGLAAGCAISWLVFSLLSRMFPIDTPAPAPVAPYAAQVDYAVYALVALAVAISGALAAKEFKE